VPTAFARLVDSIFPQHYVRIREHESRRCKIDSMLGEVGSILVGVPFELHSSIQVYIRGLRNTSRAAAATYRFVNRPSFSSVYFSPRQSIVLPKNPATQNAKLAKS